jgi:hypothetical protein
MRLVEDPDGAALELAFPGQGDELDTEGFGVGGGGDEVTGASLTTALRATTAQCVDNLLSSAEAGAALTETVQSVAFVDVAHGFS